MSHARSAAYAEGRRLREKAERRAYRRRRRGLPGPVRFVIGIMVFFWVMWIMAAVAFVTGAELDFPFPPLVIGAILFFVAVKHSRRKALRRGGAAGTAPLPARPAARPNPKAVWNGARRRFAALRAEYAAFECDPMQVLRLPALADVSVPSTGRFVDAFAEAQALETDDYPHGDHGAKFVAAVDRAERAWKAAREAAERIRLSNLTPAERNTVERVIKVLTTARDSDSDAERLAAYSLARAELAKLDRAGVIHLPRTAGEALEAAARGALPARPATAQPA